MLFAWFLNTYKLNTYYADERPSAGGKYSGLGFSITSTGSNKSRLLYIQGL